MINMKIQLLFVVFLAASFMHGVHSTTFNIRNNCPFVIAPGTLTSSGAWPSTTGFELQPGASNAIYTPATWSGRIFARFQCYWNNQGRYTCRSGDCGSGQIACNGGGAVPPATLAEFTLAGSGGKDFYDVSLVDGFNLPISLVPVGNHLAASSDGKVDFNDDDSLLIKLPSSSDGVQQLGSSCPSTNCPVDINAQCPGELAVRDPAGGTIGCKSACYAFNTAAYCCFGDHNTPQTCPATNYSRFFKNLCPKAYSYAYDDASSTFTCKTGVNYDITFCP